MFDWNGKQVYPAAAFQPYQVRVEITDLNIRTGPGTGYAKTQYIPVGTYTIVEEANGTGATKWGRLKSGAGWISLDLCKTGIISPLSILYLFGKTFCLLFRDLQK